MVAEIGINHNGNIDIAKKSIAAAAKSGADAVKFQNYITEDFISDKNIKYKYLFNGKEVEESMFDMFKRCELDDNQLLELKKYSDKFKVDFHSTPTSSKGIKILKEIGCKFIKNGSDYLTNLELIKEMGDSGLHTVLSTGMATLSEIDKAVDVFRSTGNDQLTLLHCTSCYPTPPSRVNLKRIKTLKDCFECDIGFSDHTDGNTASIGSIIYGASWIEKHFTLDRDEKGPDHRFSSDPDQFAKLVKDVRSMEQMIGNSAIKPNDIEQKSRKDFRLSCTATRDLRPGEILTRDDIAFRRPGTGIPPKDISYLLGHKVCRDIKKGTLLLVDDFQKNSR